MKKEFNEVDLPAKLDKHFRLAEHKPVGKFDHRGFTVFLSEGGPYYISDDENPLGWYETAFTLYNKDVLVYQPLRFDRLHDLNLTEDGRREARIASAKQEAIKNIDAFRNESH